MWPLTQGSTNEDTIAGTANNVHDLVTQTDGHPV